MTGRIGFTRYEFSAVFQIYSQNVYRGLFRDFSLVEAGGQYFICFREEAGKTPLITVEKRRLGPDRSLFVATTPGARGRPVEIARSEKIYAFVRQLSHQVDLLRSTRGSGAYSLSGAGRNA